MIDLGQQSGLERKFRALLSLHRAFACSITDSVRTFGYRHQELIVFCLLQRTTWDRSSRGIKVHARCKKPRTAAEKSTSVPVVSAVPALGSSARAGRSVAQADDSDPAPISCLVAT